MLSPCPNDTGYTAKSLRPAPLDRQPREHTPARIEARVLRRASTGCACAGRERCVIDFCKLRTNPSPRNLDVSVEQVALLAQQNTLPEPTLDISLLSYSSAPSSALGLGNPSGAAAATLRSSPAVAPPTDDPWTTGRFGAGTSSPQPFGGLNGGAPSSVAGSGLPSGWWKRQEKVSVQFGGQQGFVLTRYMVYGITTEVRGSHSQRNHNFSERTFGYQRGGTVQRRYSEFAFLWDCLVRRYPFRLLPQLPPKRIGRK